MLRFEQVGIEDRTIVLGFIKDNSGKFLGQFYLDPRIEGKTVVDDVLIEVTQKLQDGVGFCIRNDSALKALAIVTDSGWDSKIIGKRIGKLILYNLLSKDQTKPFLHRVCLKAKEMGFDAVFGRTNLEEMDVLQATMSIGAVLGDILLTLGIDLHELENTPSLVKIFSTGRSDLIFDEATATNGGKLRKITEFAFKHSHYFNDPNISQKTAETVYQEWIRNSLQGFADLIIVAKLEGEIIGYATFRAKKLDSRVFGTIDLIAVEKEHRGQGIGKMLVIEGIKKISSKIDVLLVSTQISNLPALRLYHSLGFRPIRSEATFHLWFTPVEKSTPLTEQVLELNHES